MSLDKEIQAVLFDFDGTLVDFDGQMSEYTKKALYQLKSNGYKVVLVTGRRVNMAISAMKKHIDPSVFDLFLGINGSQLYDPACEKTSFSHMLSPKDIRNVAEAFDDKRLMMTIYDEDAAYLSNKLDDKFMEHWSSTRTLPIVLKDFKKDFKEDYPKMTVVTNPEDEDVIRDILKNKKIDGVSFAFSGPGFLEVMPSGMDKGVAVDKIKDYYGLKDSQIMAFGDNENDIPMLKKCVGVAMGNAVEEVKKVIDRNTDDVKGKGIYEFLETNGFLD